MHLEPRATKRGTKTDRRAQCKMYPMPKRGTKIERFAKYKMYPIPNRGTKTDRIAQYKTQPMPKRERGTKTGRPRFAQLQCKIHNAAGAPAHRRGQPHQSTPASWPSIAHAFGDVIHGLLVGAVCALHTSELRMQVRFASMNMRHARVKTRPQSTWLLVVNSVIVMIANGILWVL